MSRKKIEEKQPWKLASEFRDDPEIRGTLLYRYLELEESSAKLEAIFQSGSSSSSSDGRLPAVNGLIRSTTVAPTRVC